MTKTYRQTANGTVTLQTVPETNHCGIAGGPVQLNYVVDMIFDHDALDESGFLLDNLAFRGCFEGLANTPVDMSCERLAGHVAEIMKSMLGARADKLQSITVSLSPFQGATIHHHEKR